MGQSSRETSEVRVPVGSSYFAEIRRSGSYYVDKTGLIRRIAASNAVAFLFTRPRRFGKTTAMSMLSEYFDIRKDSRDLFEGLEIMRHPEICREWMNRFPVIFVSFRNVDGLDYETAILRFMKTISDLYKEHQYLEDSDRLSGTDRDRFRRFMEMDLQKGDPENALSFLTQMLAQHYGKPVVLLIDEYDVPIAKASSNGYYREMMDVMRSLLSVIKDNPSVRLAVMTGCLRIAKESIFTGVNNMVTDTVLDRGYGEYFGFTQEEVDRLLLNAHLERYAAEMKLWYDGYHIGDVDIYCPWDVVNYVSDRLGDRIDEPKCYWINSSDNAIIRSFIDHMGTSLTGSFETLLAGGTITRTIRADMTYDVLYTGGQRVMEEHFWSVLFMTGYLTKAKPSGANPFMVREEGASYTGQTVTLCIPNREVRIIFEQTVMIWFNESVRSWDRNALFASVWSGDEEVMTAELNRLLRRTISYHDYREDFYHAFVAGVFAGAGYDVQSNREHGTGRSDITVRDHPEGRAAVFEFKYAKTKSGLEESCDQAVRQIHEKGYAGELTDLCDEVLGYGVAFYKKSCIVRKV